ncbi:NADPH-dependent F420 reductase [Rhodococcus sp. NBC_00294]|uniref:NADPH-dependent F420 reductase n=1 Tax=Rhodococcus sp. NBC_00294 TaxID=2976004 RepID=UPI002E296126|nr:NAD(P)-binding domain-containing protein [Rhodococcus sp. NBC_00294]
MKIGILGAGYIGATVARKLSAAGHHVKIANSRGPDTIDAAALSSGATAVDASEAVVDVDVVILSIPLQSIPGIRRVISAVPLDTVVIDTSNYYPGRDSTIPAIESGTVESDWVQEQLGRPVVKAWNAIGSGSLASKGMPAGSSDRIAIPVAADDPTHRQVGIDLVGDTGFDGYDAGPISESWRQQPGAPAYCTDLTMADMPAALANADASRSPKRRDIAVAAFAERYDSPTTNPSADYGVNLSRILFM